MQGSRFGKAALAALATVFISGTAQAGFIGANVTGTLTGDEYTTITMPFTSPQVVSDAVEFEGAAITTFDFNWIITVDITDATVIVGVDSPQDYANLFGEDPILTITLSGLPALPSGLTLLHYECLDGDQICTETEEPLVYSSFADGTLSIGLATLRDSDRYTFGISPTQDVPEPGALGLLGLGLVGAGLARRSRRRPRGD